MRWAKVALARGRDRRHGLLAPDPVLVGVKAVRIASADGNGPAEVRAVVARRFVDERLFERLFSERWVLADLELDVVAVEQEDEVSLLLEVTAPPAPATDERGRRRWR